MDDVDVGDSLGLDLKPPPSHPRRAARESGAAVGRIMNCRKERALPKYFSMIVVKSIPISYFLWPAGPQKTILCRNQFSVAGMERSDTQHLSCPTGSDSAVPSKAVTRYATAVHWTDIGRCLWRVNWQKIRAQKRKIKIQFSSEVF